MRSRSGRGGVARAEPEVIVHQLTAIGALGTRHFDRDVALASPAPTRQMRETLAAIRHLEEAVLGARWTEGIVLRYAAFYGPGTSFTPGAEQFELVRRRKFPLVDDGGRVWSSIHVADAAETTVAAVGHGGRGVCNMADDDPAPVAGWLPELAQPLGGKNRCACRGSSGGCSPATPGWRRSLSWWA